MSDLLYDCDVLVSRFSTVPFEAMALGTPFVYFRPAEEHVDTFNESNGAYETVASSPELSEALVRARGMLGQYREISEEFFRRQVDMADRSANERAVDAMIAVLGKD